MFARRVSAAGSLAPKRKPGSNYAESAARSSVLSKSRRSGGGGSVIEGSAWGGSDDTGLESVKGDLEQQYIEMLRRSKKRSKAPPQLPSEWLPEARWETLKGVQEAAAPVPRAGHALVAAAPPPAAAAGRGYGAADMGAAQGFDHLFVIGGAVGSTSQPRGSTWLSRDKGSKPGSDAGPAQRTPREDQGVACLRVGPAIKPPHAMQAEWQRAAVPPPPRRLTDCPAVALAGGLAVAVFGGVDLERGEVSGGLFVLDVLRGAWRDETAAPGGPPPCAEHAAAEADGGRAMLVHGGRGSLADPSPLSSLRRLALASDGRVAWHEVRAKEGQMLECIADSVLARPPARRGHSCCTRGGAEGAPCAYFFGGFGESGEVGAELSVLDIDRGIFLAVDAIGAPPVPRAFHTAVRMGPYMAVFGGIGIGGAAIAELRLLHLPTLTWAMPLTAQGPAAPLSPGEERTEEADGKSPGRVRKLRSAKTMDGAYHDAAEPVPRSRHGAVLSAAGCKPGERAMLIFGGQGAQPCNVEVSRLVLQMPLEREPTCAERKHPDKAYEFAMASLETSMRDARTAHDDQMKDARLQALTMTEEARNLETRGLGVQAQIEKFETYRARQLQEEDALAAKLEEEAAALEALQKDTRQLLRELEVEAESLAAKAQRLESESTADFGGMLPDGEVAFASGGKVGKVPNLLLPGGFVDRRDTRWRGARVTAEGIVLGALPEQPRPESRTQESRSSSPSGTRSRGPSPVPPEFREHRATPPPGRSSLRGSMFAISTLEPPRVDVGRWLDAARAELRAMSMLRHPCLQEVYGATFADSTLCLLTEPLMESLAARLARGRDSGRGSHSPGGGGGGATRRLSSTRRGSCEGPSAWGSWALNEAQKLHISCDLLAALEYLHSKGVVHRHVVAENVFIRENGAEASASVKLGGCFAARVSCRVRGEPVVPQAALVADLQEVAQEVAAAGLSARAGCRGAPKILARANTLDFVGIMRDAGTLESLSDSPEPGATERRRGFAQGGFDARFLDVRSAGVVLLKVWLYQEPSARKSGAAFSGMGEDLASNEEVRSAQINAGNLALVAEIRDASVRLAVASCLRPDDGFAARASTLGSRVFGRTRSMLLDEALAGSRWGSDASEDSEGPPRPPSASVLRAAFETIKVGDLKELPVLAQDPSRAAVLADHAVDPQEVAARA